MKRMLSLRPRVLRRHHVAFCLLLGLAAGSPGLTPALRAADDPIVGALTLEPTHATLVAPEWLARARAINQRQKQAAQRAALLDNLTQTRDADDLLAAPLAAAPSPIGSAMDIAPRRAERVNDAAPTSPLPDADARPADYAASGFAPATPATPGYSHATFAADMLAAPARAHIASELRGDWMGPLDDTRTAPAAVTDRASQTVAAPAWSGTAPGASFAPAARATSSFTPTFTTNAPAASLPAAVGPFPGVSGTAYAWGYNLNGQVGNGTTTNQTTPTAVQGLPGGSNVTAVSSGAGQTLYVVNGAVYASGNNASGQLGNGMTTGNSGANQTTATPALVLTSGVTNVASGFTQCLAIQNGALFTWGNASNGVLGNGTSTGNVTTPTAVSGYGSGVTLIAGNQNNSYVVRNGALFACGANSVGQLGNGTIQPSSTLQTTFTATNLTSGVTSVSNGQAHALAIQNGALYSWGFNTNGQLGNGTFYVNNNGPGGTNGNPTPTVVLGLGTGVTSASAGYNHSLAVMNGNVYAWGNNQTGQLGTGSTLPSGTYQTTAIQIDPTDLTNILQVVAGDYSSYALAADGSLWVWGRNQAGQLGLGDTVERDSPTHLLAPTGFYYSALSADGSGGASFGNVVGILTAGTAPAVVPEPGTWAGGALLVGAAGLTLNRRLHRAARA